METAPGSNDGGTARSPGGLVPDSVRLPWSVLLYGALAGAVAAIPVAGLALADFYAAIIALFGSVWTIHSCLLLSVAAAASDYLLPSWTRPRRWSVGMGAASLLVVSWLVIHLLPESSGKAAHTGAVGLLRAGAWVLVGAAMSAVYGRVAGVAASRRADGLRVGPQMGALVAFVYVSLDVLLGGPLRRGSDGAAMLISWVLLVVTAGALLGFVLSWQVRVAARQAGCEPSASDP